MALSSFSSLACGLVHYQTRSSYYSTLPWPFKISINRRYYQIRLVIQKVSNGGLKQIHYYVASQWQGGLARLLRVSDEAHGCPRFTNEPKRLRLTTYFDRSWVGMPSLANIMCLYPNLHDESWIETAVRSESSHHTVDRRRKHRHVSYFNPTYFGGTLCTSIRQLQLARCGEPVSWNVQRVPLRSVRYQ